LSNSILNGVKLVIALGGFAAKPSTLAALKASVSVEKVLKEILRDQPASMSSLAATLERDAQETFRGFARDLPVDAPVLYEQMVLAGLPGAIDVIASDMNAEKVTSAMLASHSDPEHRTPSMQELFRAITEPTLARLLADPSFAIDLTPAFMAGVLQRLSDQSRTNSRIEAMVDDLPKKIRQELFGVTGGVSKTMARGLSTLVVDLFRMLYVLGSDEAKTLNLDRFEHFVELADQHFDEFRIHVHRSANGIDAKLLGEVEQIERECAWVLGQIKRRTDITFDLGRCFASMKHVTEKAFAIFVMSIPDDVAIAQAAVDSAYDASLSDKQVGSIENYRLRLSVQSAILPIPTIAFDALQEYSLHYFLIDKRLLSST
jgi:hypothetical protein